MKIIFSVSRDFCSTFILQYFYKAVLNIINGGFVKIVKVTRKRQITLPKEVSEKAGIKVGDYVRVYIDESGRIVVEKVLGLDDLAGVLNPGYSVRGLAEDLDKSRKVGERG